MYIDIACLGKTTTEEQTRDVVFAASEHHLNGVCVLPSYVAEMKQYTTDMILSCPIDYPQGTSHTKVRNHAVLAAIRRGANAIDLVINHTLAINLKMEELLDDVASNLEICRDNDVSLRIMMEYRVFEDGLLQDLAYLMQAAGVEYVFPSTGHRLDNHIDNLIVAKNVFEKSGLKVICNGPFNSEKHYKEAKKADVFGVRFTSVPVIKEIFGV